jgi:hypothetical protein
MDHLLETEHENERIVPGLSRPPRAGSQRLIAAEFGIPPNLVNDYQAGCSCLHLLWACYAWPCARLRLRGKVRSIFSPVRSVNSWCLPVTWRHRLRT